LAAFFFETGRKAFRVPFILLDGPDELTLLHLCRFYSPLPGNFPDVIHVHFLNPFSLVWSANGYQLKIYLWRIFSILCDEPILSRNLRY